MYTIYIQEEQILDTFTFCPRLHMESSEPLMTTQAWQDGDEIRMVVSDMSGEDMMNVDSKITLELFVNGDKVSHVLA